MNEYDEVVHLGRMRWESGWTTYKAIHHFFKTAFCGWQPTMVPWGETEVELPTGESITSQPQLVNCPMCLVKYDQFLESEPANVN